MPQSDPLPTARAWWLPLSLAVSATAHALFAFVVLSALETPDLGIEFEIPSEVEFGLTESVSVASAPTAPPPPPPPPEPEPASPVIPTADAGAKPAPQDAGEPEDNEPQERDAGVADAGPERTPSEAGAAPALAQTKGKDAGAAETDAGGPTEHLPPGAQIAVRVDMTRVRESPIAKDVTGLLQAIPDWKALLDGSGIDPVKELDRLLIATPNLQRSRLVMAGRHFGGRERVNEAVASLAAARGVKAPWRTEHGVPVAKWANLDATERVVAVVGPQHFVISRPQDLVRVVSVAAARAEREARDRRGEDDGAETKKEVQEHPADALLSMEEGEGLSLEVEGVRNFIRRGRGIPTRLRLAAIEVPGPRVQLRGRWQYEDENLAQQALAFWDGARKRYARNTMVMLLGLSAPLATGSLEVQGTELLLKVELTVQQTRLIIGYLKELVAPPPPPRPLDLPPASPGGWGGARPSRPATLKGSGHAPAPSPAPVPAKDP